MEVFQLEACGISERNNALFFKEEFPKIGGYSSIKIFKNVIVLKKDAENLIVFVNNEWVDCKIMESDLRHYGEEFIDIDISTLSPQMRKEILKAHILHEEII